MRWGAALGLCCIGAPCWELQKAMGDVPLPAAGICKALLGEKGGSGVGYDRREVGMPELGCSSISSDKAGGPAPPRFWLGVTPWGFIQKRSCWCLQGWKSTRNYLGAVSQSRTAQPCT